MGANTKIEWCHFTLNPWRGCQKVAAGCTNCYADSQSKRNPGVLGIWGPNGSRVIASEDMWKKPLKWNREAQCNCGAAGMGDRQCKWCEGGCQRPRVFCASLSDVFEEWDGKILDSHGNLVWFNESIGVMEIDDGQEGFAFRRRWATLNDVRARLFKLIDSTPNLDWLLLTKRPENIRRMWPFDPGTPTAIFPGMPGPLGQPQSCVVQRRRDNVWLGTSIAEQADADRNIPLLLQCRDLAPVLFLSIEPLIGPIDLHQALYVGPEGGWEYHGAKRGMISWVIVGGESGPHARPCHVDWIRSIVRQCREAGVPCFVKQLGDNAWIDPQELSDMRASPGYKPLKADKGGDPDEWHEDMRVREFPAVTVK